MMGVHEYVELTELALADAASADDDWQRRYYFLQRAQVLVGLAHVSSMPTLRMPTASPRAELPLNGGGILWIDLADVEAIVHASDVTCAVRLSGGVTYLVDLHVDETVQRLRATA